MMYVGRIVCGLAAGVCTAAVPSYIGKYNSNTIIYLF